MTDWPESLIREVPDFPKPGVMFKDITPLLSDPKAFRWVTEQLAQRFNSAEVDLVAGVEARGFIVGTAVAQLMEVGFVPLRKPGKLPAQVRSVNYELEYGSDALEMHADALSPGQRVLIVDDVLATGGTAAASVALVEQSGAHVVGLGVLIELQFLGGSALLDGHRVDALWRYGAEA